MVLVHLADDHHTLSHPEHESVHTATSGYIYCLLRSVARPPIVHTLLLVGLFR
jgi:hypothetical protein